MTNQLENLKKLRAPFPANQISKLPKPTKSQTDAVKNNYQNGIRCHICGGWHHKDVIHLDYVGHAALTDRLLETDPCWTWEPFALDSNGLPAIDKDGGLWIRLTVCGVTRIGYGDAQGKSGGDAMKERIGDALRNAAMRFGAALDLWHKGDLHDDDKPEQNQEPRMPNLANVQDSQLNETPISDMSWLESEFTGYETLQELTAAFSKAYNNAPKEQKPEIKAVFDKVKMKFKG